MLPHPQGLYMGLRRQNRKARQASLLHGPERGTADHGTDAPTDAKADAKADAQTDSSADAQPHQTAQCQSQCQPDGTAQCIPLGISHLPTVGIALILTQQHAQLQSHHTRQAVHGL